MSSAKLSAAILVISDTASKDPSTDKCGPTLRQVFAESGSEQWEDTITEIIPDDVDAITNFIQSKTDSKDAKNVSLIVTSGGTGFAIKDRTPEAIEPLLHRKAPGLVHGMLAASLSVTPFALMSRPVAGVRNSTLIITLPGSPKGAKENLEAIIKLLPHACIQSAGADSRSIHAGGVKKLEQEAGVPPGPSSVILSHRKPGQTGGHSHSHSHSNDHHGHSHSHSHGGPGSHPMPVRHTASDSHPQSNDPSAGPTRRYRESPYPMLSVEEALNLIADNTPAPEIVTVPVNQGIVAHVLAEEVKAPESVPAFRASIVDGYAIKLPSSGKFEAATYPVSLVSHAQAANIPPLQDGAIARITTGAPLPPGADAVIMVEDTILKSKTDDGREEKEVEILSSEPKSGDNVREIGSDVRKGDIIIGKGEGISVVGGEFGLLASVGAREAKVYRKPVVGVLSTGDEIVEHDHPGGLRLGEVRDTNRPTLLTAIHGSGFKAVDLGIASDKPGTLESTLRSSFQKVDVVITTGGVSMGELDLLKPTLERSLGGTIHFGRVAMKPGKPTTFATVPIKDASSGIRSEKLVFALPGNPASAVVTYHLFVLPALHRMSGIEPPGLPRVQVVLGEDVRPDAKRMEFHRAVVGIRGDGRLVARSTGGQRSSRIGSFKGANALLVIPSGKKSRKKGDCVEALIMGNLGPSME